MKSKIPFWFKIKAKKTLWFGWFSSSMIVTATLWFSGPLIIAIAISAMIEGLSRVSLKSPRQLPDLETFQVCVEVLKLSVAAVPSALLTAFGALLVFRYGTKELENTKQLNQFHEKYIKLKIKIDLNRNRMEFDQEDFEDSLKEFSAIFVEYTNLIYEEILAVGNRQVRLKMNKDGWLGSFADEMNEYARVFEAKIKIADHSFLTKYKSEKAETVGFTQHYEYYLDKIETEDLHLTHNILQNAAFHYFTDLQKAHSKQNMTQPPSFSIDDILKNSRMILESSYAITRPKKCPDWLWTQVNDEIRQALANAQSELIKANEKIKKSA